jgi:L-threonylcarbamoyladenylate synthase
VVVPTDTVYGIACSAFDKRAVERVYALKGRAYDKPLPVLIPDASLLPLVGIDVPPEAARLTDKYWPGPLTIVVKTGPLAIAAAHGRSTIAVRVPDHGILRDVLDRAAVPIAATSANRSGHKSITDGTDAIAQFSGEVDVIVDGGPCRVGRESSVVDVTRFPFLVSRVGALSKQELERTLRVG